MGKQQDMGDGFAATCPSSLRSPEPVCPVSAHAGDGQVQEAATEIGRLVNRILELAPTAGLYVSVKITQAQEGVR